MNRYRSGVLASRWIIPVSAPPINGGWIRIVDGIITEVQTGTPPSEAVDLGDVAILPGLVNAHTHLEFSDLERPIGEAGIGLARWIGLVVAARESDLASSRTDSIRHGLAELRSTGAVLAGEITTPPSIYPSDVEIPKLITFAEILGLSKQRAEERIAAAVNHLRSFPNGGLSPHAPYSIGLSAFNQAMQLAHERELAVAMHVAESPEERELLTAGTGALAESLRSLGVWRPGLFPWGPDPFIGLVDQLVSAKRVLLVHGNQLNEDEIQHLRRYDHISIVYCPRTHHFFGFQRHPVAEMLASGIRVALGTDSRASSPDLNLWREVQFLLHFRPDLHPLDVIQMATLNGAQALGEREYGAIGRGHQALFGCVPTEAPSLDRLYEDFASQDYEVIDAEFSPG